MAYFQMDDGFETEARVMRAGKPAFGLYAACGIWVARHLTDGFIPTEIAVLYGTREWIERLVTTGLWLAVDGGFDFSFDYLGIHGNPTAETVRKRRADAAARKQKQRARSGRPPNRSQGESRVTGPVTHTGSPGSLSSPPPKGGEGAAPPPGGAPPPPRTIKTTDGRHICETHRLEVSDTVPCRGCAGDAKAAAADDLDQRPPIATPPDRTEPDDGDQIRNTYLAARGVLDSLPKPDRDQWLATARRHLSELGEDKPNNYRLTTTAVQLYSASQRPDPPPHPDAAGPP